MNLYIKNTKNVNSNAIRISAYSELNIGHIGTADYKFHFAKLEQDNIYGSYIGRAAVKLARGDGPGAMEDLRFVIKSKGESGYYNNEVCWILSRFALPAAAMPYCDKANDLYVSDPAKMDSLAFALWQRGDTPAARKLLVDARGIDKSMPGSDTRIEQFRTLLATAFLFRKGYDPGQISTRIDDKTFAAIQAFQRDQGLPPTGIIDVKLLGRLTPLGFGSFGIRELSGELTTDQIKSRCAKAIYGDVVEITGKSGSRFQCNTDGLSVRRTEAQ